MEDVTWVVLANGSLARIARALTQQEFEEVERLEHPASRLANRELASDAPGRASEGASKMHRLFADPVSPKEGEKDRFAHEVARYLNEAYKRGDFQRLYLIASPSFLGDLRAYLSSQLRESVVSSIAKDYTSIELRDLHKQLYLTLGV